MNVPSSIIFLPRPSSLILCFPPIALVHSLILIQSRILLNLLSLVFIPFLSLLHPATLFISFAFIPHNSLILLTVIPNSPIYCYPEPACDTLTPFIPPYSYRLLHLTPHCSPSFMYIVWTYLATHPYSPPSYPSLNMISDKRPYPHHNTLQGNNDITPLSPLLKYDIW